MDEKVLFEEDQKKIDDSVRLHAMGSHQIGEIAEISATLYDRGVDVVRELQRLQRVFNVGNAE